MTHHLRLPPPHGTWWIRFRNRILWPLTWPIRVLEGEWE